MTVPAKDIHIALKGLDTQQAMGNPTDSKLRAGTVCFLQGNEAT